MIFWVRKNFWIELGHGKRFGINDNPVDFSFQFNRSRFLIIKEQEGNRLSEKVIDYQQEDLENRNIRGRTECHTWPTCLLEPWRDGWTTLEFWCYRGFERVCRWSCLGAQLLSHIWLFVTSWTVAHQAPLSIAFSRQEYQGGLPFKKSKNFMLIDPLWNVHVMVMSVLYNNLLTQYCLMYFRL